MKKLFLPLSLLLIVCFCSCFQGCVAREQFVENQIYTCTQNPKLKAKINNNLKYLGDFKRNRSVSNPGFADIANYETYLFVDSEDGEITKALLFISRQFKNDKVYTELKCTRVDQTKVFLNEYIKIGIDRHCRTVGLMTPAPFFRFLGINVNKEGKKLHYGNYIYESVAQVAGNGGISYQIYYMEQVKKALGTYVSGAFWDFDLENMSADDKKSFDIFLTNSKMAFKRLPYNATTLPKIISKDDSFVKFDNGIIFDTKTNLEWYVGPNKKHSWEEANRWIKKLQIAGNNWRMPNISELKSLYRKGFASRNMSALFDTHAWGVWSSEKKKSKIANSSMYFPWYFDFFVGDKKWALGSNSRVFAVRKVKI